MKIKRLFVALLMVAVILNLMTAVSFAKSKVVTKEESTLVIWHCLSLRTLDVHSQNKHLVFSLCQAVLAKKEKKKKNYEKSLFSSSSPLILS